MRDRCTWIWTSREGCEGCSVTGPNGNSIFLPATSRNKDFSSLGFYWSNNDAAGLLNGRWFLCFDSLGITLLPKNRSEISFPVRPVFCLDSQKGSTSIIDGFSVNYKLYPNCESATKVNRYCTRIQNAFSLFMPIFCGLLGIYFCWMALIVYFVILSHKLKNKLSDIIALKYKKVDKF